MADNNCEKYIKLLLDESGNCALNGQNAAAGFPVAGESNAFKVELTFPEGVKNFSDKKVYVGFGGKNYWLNLVAGERGEYYFYLPSLIDRGGAISITAEATKSVADNSSEIVRVKWKPYYLTVLDAPVYLQENLPNDPNYLKNIETKLAETSDLACELDNSAMKKADYNFVVESAAEDFSKNYVANNGETYKMRSLKLEGVSPNGVDGSAKLVDLRAVTEAHNGDMTPEMLAKLKAGVVKSDFPDESVVSNVEIKNPDDDIPDEELPEGESPIVKDKNKLHIVVTKSFVGNGGVWTSASTALPLASSEGCGLLSVEDKLGLNAAVEHIHNGNNPHGVNKKQIGLDKVENERQYSAQNMQPFPYGFTSGNSNFDWGVNAGSPVRSWSVGDEGTVGFKKNCPTDGKMSMLVNGKVYVQDGEKEVATLDSPFFVGKPLTPTPLQDSDDLQIANTAWVNSKLPIYRHRVSMGAIFDRQGIVAHIDLYTNSEEVLNSAAKIIEAAGVKQGNNSANLPASGFAEYDSWSVLCTQALVNQSEISLLGIYFSSNSGNGIIDKVKAKATEFSDDVMRIN